MRAGAAAQIGVRWGRRQCLIGACIGALAVGGCGNESSKPSPASGERGSTQATSPTATTTGSTGGSAPGHTGGTPPNNPSSKAGGSPDRSHDKKSVPGGSVPAPAGERIEADGVDPPFDNDGNRYPRLRDADLTRVSLQRVGANLRVKFSTATEPRAPARYVLQIFSTGKTYTVIGKMTVKLVAGKKPSGFIVNYPDGAKYPRKVTAEIVPRGLVVTTPLGAIAKRKKFRWLATSIVGPLNRPILDDVPNTPGGSFETRLGRYP